MRQLRVLDSRLAVLSQSTSSCTVDRFVAEWLSLGLLTNKIMDTLSMSLLGLRSRITNSPYN